MKPGASGGVGPDHLPGGVDVLCAIGEVQTQVHSRVDFERRMTLNGSAVFADVHDLVEIKHGALRFCGERGIRGSLDLVPHTTAAVGGTPMQRACGSHEKGPNFLWLHISAVLGKSKQKKKVERTMGRDLRRRNRLSPELRAWKPKGRTPSAASKPVYIPKLTARIRAAPFQDAILPSWRGGGFGRGAGWRCGR